MPAKIVFNGQEYASVEEMPPELRRVYEQMMQVFADQDQNGVPDVVEGLMAQMPPVAAAFNLVNFNGQNYTSLEHMPPEVRQAYEQAMSTLSALGDRNQNGVPDLLEGAAPLLQSGPRTAQAPPGWVQPAAQPSAPMAPAPRPAQPAPPPVITGDVEAGGRNLKLILFGLGLVLVLVLVAAGVAVLLFGQYLFPR